MLNLSTIEAIRLRSHCTIFCKRVNARAEIRHTDPLECSNCKIFACGKKLAHAKKRVSFSFSFHLKLFIHEKKPFSN